MGDGIRDLTAGLRPGRRYRCGACGNVTRFDVVSTTTRRAYHHFDLGGTVEIEEEEILDQHVAAVTCRWCGREDAIDIEAAPSGQVDGAPDGD